MNVSMQIPKNIRIFCVSFNFVVFNVNSNRIINLKKKINENFAEKIKKLPLKNQEEVKE